LKKKENNKKKREMNKNQNKRIKEDNVEKHG